MTRILDEASYRQALLDKLVEEAGEAASASTANLLHAMHAGFVRRRPLRSGSRRSEGLQRPGTSRSG